MLAFVRHAGRSGSDDYVARGQGRSAVAWSDNQNRAGHDPWEMQSRAEADQKVREVERGHPSLEGSAADVRSLRAWLPLLVILAVAFVVLLVLSLPR